MSDPGGSTSAPACWQPATPDDLDAATQQLGRPVRGVAGVAHRCGCGRPDVLVTAPSLPDGSPFPTLYYLTCPRATGVVSTLESESVMRAMAEALAQDADLAAAHRHAHEAYLSDRATLGEHPAIAGISAGGMPDRVKCLHVLVAHSLATGPGVNPLGDQVLALLAARGIDPAEAWGGSAGGCVPGPAHAASSRLPASGVAAANRPAGPRGGAGSDSLPTAGGGEADGRPRERPDSEAP